MRHMLVLSPRALRGYIVARRGCCMGVLCASHVALSAMLSVPLVGPLPSLAAYVGKKSRSKRIFAAADVNALPSIFDLFVYSPLPSAIVLMEFLSLQPMRFIIKIDDEVIGR